MTPIDFDAHFSDLFEGAFAQFSERLDPEKLPTADTDLSSIVSEALPTMVEVASDTLVQSLHRRAPEMVAEHEELRRGFEERLAARWGRAFDLAQMVMVCAREVGDAFNHKHASLAAQERDLVFSALVRLHARACRISEEVMGLMRAGFGQAAMARWRALHEVAVAASFVEEHGQETAERYFAHEHIEAWRGMLEYQQHAERLGRAPFDGNEVQEAQRRRDELCAKYGRRFADSYGWANHALAAVDPSFANRVVRLSDIEKAARLDHLRPYYRMASHSIHANPKGITFNPDLLGEGILLAGASDAGFVEPGHSTLVSLVQVTASLLTSKSGAATPVILTALLQLTDEAGDAYLEAHKKLIADSAGDGACLGTSDADLVRARPPRTRNGHDATAHRRRTPSKGWFVYFRLYGPEAAFDGTWQLPT